MRRKRTVCGLPCLVTTVPGLATQWSCRPVSDNSTSVNSYYSIVFDLKVAVHADSGPPAHHVRVEVSPGYLAILNQAQNQSGSLFIQRFALDIQSCRRCSPGDRCHCGGQTWSTQLTTVPHRTYSFLLLLRCSVDRSTCRVDTTPAVQQISVPILPTPHKLEILQAMYGDIRDVPFKSGRLRFSL